MDVELEARGLGHRYARGRGLDPLDFTLRGAGLVAITGPNGSGKSTLLRILAGLLRPSHGVSRVRIAGAEFRPADRRKVTGWASPDLHFYTELTVRENLEFAAEARGFRDAAGEVESAASAVGLASLFDDRVAALSSGMRQRLRLAFALLGDPPVLLLDEPGSHLDDRGRAHLRDVLERKRAATRVVLATNDPKETELAEQRIALTGRDLGDPA